MSRELNYETKRKGGAERRQSIVLRVGGFVSTKEIRKTTQLAMLPAVELQDEP